MKIRDVAGSTAQTLRETWQSATVEDVWLRPGDWYHPAVDAMTEALVAGECAAPAAFRLGEMRGSAGVGITETLDDVAVLYGLLGGEPPLEVTRSLCEGWGAAVEAAPVRAGCVDPESGLPSLDYLAVRLGETYGTARRHAYNAFVSHALVIVDVAAGDLHPWRRLARSAAMGQALGSALPPGHPMASLGGGVFAVLVARDWDVGEIVRRTREAVNEQAQTLKIGELLRQPPRIWVEPLPETHAQAVDLLENLRR